MRAERLQRFRQDYDDGAILEITIWRVPQPVAGSRHPYKYRLFYGYPGRRLVLYDNERGKGDHRHVGRRESSYRFVSPQKLVDDFLADVENLRGGL